MATTDARLSVGLASHPKTKKLIRRLGGDGAWRLVCLLLWCAANRPDGSLMGMSDEDIELAVDWSGEEGALVAAMRDVGFLDGDEGFRSVHDWEEHNPWAAGSDARSQRAKFASLCRDYGRERAQAMMPEYAIGDVRKVSGRGQKDIETRSSSDLVDHPGDRKSDLVDDLPDDLRDEQTDLLDGPVDDLVDGVRSSPYPSPSPIPSPSPKEKSNPLSTCVDLVGESPPAEPAPKVPPAEVREVFDHWRKTMNSPKSQLDAKRVKAIKTALRTGYSVDDLRSAIDGCSKTPHNMGQNDRGQKYNGIELILRNADQIDRFIANDAQAPIAGEGRVELGDGRYRLAGRFYGADGRPEVVL